LQPNNKTFISTIHQNFIQIEVLLYLFITNIKLKTSCIL